MKFTGLILLLPCLLTANARPHMDKTAFLRQQEFVNLRAWRNGATATIGSNQTEPNKDDFWYGWTTSAPDSTDYNEETTVSWMPCTVEGFFARIFCLLIASSPLILAALAEEQLTRAHLLESVALITWLGGILYLFCNVLKFRGPWDGFRPLTLVEAVYLISQILTTVGYGDITPAFPRGQVWVGLNVIVALLLYGSMVMEVVGIVQERFAKAMAQVNTDVDSTQPLKNWLPKVDNSSFVKTIAFFAFMASIGVVFWANFPGENKTWFQAVYMSIITLSTVGFGAFSATTEAGKVFGAFWMLFGVAALGALIGGFVEWMSAQKNLQSFYLFDHEQEFKSMLDACSKDGKTLSKLEFLQFAVKLTKGTDDKELAKIMERFAYLRKQDKSSTDWVRRTTLVDSEGPPL